MCGIVASVGDRDIVPRLIQGLARLEYRGYDSCGLAVINSTGNIDVRKGVGPVVTVVKHEHLANAHGTVGIGHTRWATHGKVSVENAHPHLSCDGNFAVVHNGIITNYDAVMMDLKCRGHRFSSETDTEVIAHLIEDMYGFCHSVEEAFVRAIRTLIGTFAVAMISPHDPQQIFCARFRSPLLIGVARGAMFIGSDVNAFLPYTRHAIVLDDGDYAVLSSERYAVRGIADGHTRRKATLDIEWSEESGDKAAHRYYMEKEIWEQPEVICRALSVPHSDISALARRMRAATRNVLVGVGTTYYVGLFGQYVLRNLAGEFAAVISSDEAPGLIALDPGTMVLAISQSGETYDTLQVLRLANAARVATAAIVNVPGSTMTREAGMVICQHSGPEISVVSTKAAMAQMVLLIRAAVELARSSPCGFAGEVAQILHDLTGLPELVAATLHSQQAHIRKLADKYRHFRNWFFLGRGPYTAIALEAALKMKEVTYLHVEGMSAGFLKHGTLSVVDEETPCVFLIPPKEAGELYDLTMSSVAEVKARRGKVIAVGFENDGNGSFDELVRLPAAALSVAPLLHLVAGQVFAYEMAVALGRNVDRPRSLAKSVTVA